MIEALKKTLGVVTAAADKIGIERTSHYRWMKEDEDYKKSVEDIENIAVDFAESKLFKLINDGDTASTIFFLKTKGKSRGYIEKQEIDHTTKGEAINAPKTLADLYESGKSES